MPSLQLPMGLHTRTAGGSLNISHVERSGCSCATRHHLAGRNVKGAEAAHSHSSGGRAEQIACLFLHFVPYYAAQWEKCGPTNYSPTQGHFPELESDSIRSVNSWCSERGGGWGGLQRLTVLLILWVL